MTEELNHPGELLRISGQYWESCALHAAVKLDLFTMIGPAGAFPADLAARLGGDPDSVERLLGAMAGLGLLTRQKDAFHLTPLAGEYLSRDSEKYLGFMILHHRELVDSWSRIDEAVLSGEPVRARASTRGEETRRNFLIGMFNTAMLLFPLVNRAVDLSGRRRLLDLGGGPGTYAINFCRTYPDLTAVVCDLPATRPFAEETIAGFGLSDRIEFRYVDFTAEPVGGSFDAAWLSHILHGEGPEKAALAVKSAADALEPGGLMLVHDFILDDDRAGPCFPALFSLNMMLGTQEGRSYTQGEITEMMTSAGLKDVERLPFRAPNDSGIITGVK